MSCLVRDYGCIPQAWLCYHSCWQPFASVSLLPTVGSLGILNSGVAHQQRDHLQCRTDIQQSQCVQRWLNIKPVIR